MGNIIKWLEENGIEYSVIKYGNHYYFNDNFSVEGIQVVFYFDGIGNNQEKEKLLTNYMKRKRSYTCTYYRFGAGYFYRIMTKLDSVKLEEHENKISEAVEKFWQKEHAHRTQEIV